MRIYRPLGKGAVGMGPGTFVLWQFMTLIVYMCFAVIVVFCVAGAVMLIWVYGAAVGTYDWNRAGRAHPWSLYVRPHAQRAKVVAAKTAQAFGIGRE